MNSTILAIGSITQSIKARKLLTRVGIRSELIKVDDLKNQSGCIYGIRFLSPLFYSVISELKNNDIDYSVYSN